MVVQPLPRRRLLLAEAVVVLQRMPGRLGLPQAAWRCGRPIGRPQRFLLQQQAMLVRDNEDAHRLQRKWPAKVHIQMRRW